MTNYASGHTAEKVAAEYLSQQGYDILAINWRHKRAEIDIIARKHKRFGRPYPLLFFEVKHRKKDDQGTGLEYITPQKVRQMAFAAELYVAINDYAGDFMLGAIELSGQDYTITEVIENIVV
ncbi:YraN family protein [Candidatus Saccharibacteria bacterium]|nr:YraN family protein [Candidatus Saccharibacteria bacterium]